MAETITLGKVSISPKGAYSSTTSYTFLDTVSHNGGAFLCLQNATGIEPGVSNSWQTYWMVIGQGIKTVELSSPQAGKVTITATLSNGIQTSLTFDTSSIAAGSIGTTELADNSVTTPKVANSAITAPKIANEAVSKSLTVTLTVAGWSNNSQTVTASGVTTSNTVIVTPAPASFIAYGKAQVRCTAQASNSLTFQCENTPTAALTVNVTYINK